MYQEPAKSTAKLADLALLLESAWFECTFRLLIDAWYKPLTAIPPRAIATFLDHFLLPPITYSGVCAFAYGIRMFHNLAASTISIVAIHFWLRSQLEAVESYRIVLHWGMMSSSYSILTDHLPFPLKCSSKKIPQADPIRFLKPRLIVYPSQIPPCASALISLIFPTLIF
jgi:hypothetical protein